MAARGVVNLLPAKHTTTTVGPHPYRPTDTESQPGTGETRSAPEVHLRRSRPDSAQRTTLGVDTVAPLAHQNENELDEGPDMDAGAHRETQEHHH